uniref:Transglutaminase n=1 Tax=uncultured bacterium 12-5D TaxID=1497524 RepID=A0A059U268_9BACT|nr:transglutaminase [uncultured bacterium 12-5D]
MSLDQPVALNQIARCIAREFRNRKIKVTIGGEPTFVPFDPVGDEWHVSAVGPTKLEYAYNLAEALTDEVLPGSACFYSQGKNYPGEQSPRWVLWLLSNRDGSPLISPSKSKSEAAPAPEHVDLLRKFLVEKLRVGNHWLKARDPTRRPRSTLESIAVLPLDHDGKRWFSCAWKIGGAGGISLQNAEGPAGLRLPLHRLPANVNRRALVLELNRHSGTLDIFLPPLRQKPFLKLLGLLTRKLNALHIRSYRLQTYLPEDEANCWNKIGISADPGVLEVNLPPCGTWKEYDHWLRALETCAHRAGLRSFKELSPDEVMASGGGNHLLLGGPSLEANPFFTRPAWITSIVRFFQHHPSLAYLATGKYVGRASQAPRADESASSLHELEMAYRCLETLGPGDHRYLICETLRNLHADESGSSHRCEISFDKFWCPNGPDGSCAGLIEFRAIESLPKSEWNSLVALLWLAIACRLLRKSFSKPLIDFGDSLHDRFLLPSLLWEDFEAVLRDLRRHEFSFPIDPFRSLWEWQFPRMLEFKKGPSHLEIRLAHEAWPLVGDVPHTGQNTSRFVDTSVERLEFTTSKAFAENFRLYVNGREIGLKKFPEARLGAGLCYRRSARYPSLHPCIPPQLPLVVALTPRRGFRPIHAWELASVNHRYFQPCDPSNAIGRRRKPCRTASPDHVTYDLRIE